jgi:hypothetical protein
MSFDYSELAAEVQTILDEFGREATLNRKGTPVYDPATGRTTTTPLTQTLQAAKFPYGDKLIDGTLIRAGDEQLYASAYGTTLVPQPGDTITWGTETWNVVRAKHIAPAGVFVLFEVQVRK